MHAAAAAELVVSTLTSPEPPTQGKVLPTVMFSHLS